MKKQILILVFSFLFIKAGCVLADEAEESSCGSDCSWHYDSETKTLTITGSSDMKDFGPNAAVGSLKTEYWKERPWNSVASEVEHVVVNGMTSVGNRAFQGMTKIIDVELSDSVTSIGRSSFQQNTSLQTIIIPKNVTTMYADIFGSVNGTVSIFCSEQNKSMCVDALKTNARSDEQINNMLHTYAINGERYVFDGKEYKSLADYRNNIEYLPKRIYTIEEANAVSGKKNSVMIRYK